MKLGAVFPEAWSFLLRDKPRVESSCFAKGKASSRPLLKTEKPSPCGSRSRERSSVYAQLLRGRPYDVTVETMQPCLLNWVNRENILLKEHSDACLHAVQHIHTQLRNDSKG